MPFVIAGVAGVSFAVLWGLAHFWDGASVNTNPTSSSCSTFSNYDRTTKTRITSEILHVDAVDAFCFMILIYFDGSQTHILLLVDRIAGWAPATSPHLRSWIWCSLPSAMLANIQTGADSSRWTGNLMFPEMVSRYRWWCFYRSHWWPGGSHLPGYTPWASACLSPGSGGNNVPRSPRARKFHININNFRKQRGLTLQYPHLYSCFSMFSMFFPYFWHPWSPMDPWWDQFLPRSGPPERAFASLLPAHAAVLFEADSAWTLDCCGLGMVIPCFSKGFLPILLIYHIIMYYHIHSYILLNMQIYWNLLKSMCWMHLKYLNPIDVMKIGDLDFQFRWCPASAVSGLCGFQLGVRTPQMRFQSICNLFLNDTSSYILITSCVTID